MTSISNWIFVGLMFAALAACDAPSAGAEQIDGAIDGEARQWHVLTGPDGSTASFTEISPGIFSVSIQGHREDRFAVEGSVGLTFTVMNCAVVGSEAIYFPEGGFEPNYTDIEAADGLELDAITFGEDSARITGRYRGELLYKDSLTSEPDGSESIALELDFDLDATRNE